MAITQAEEAFGTALTTAQGVKWSDGFLSLTDRIIGDQLVVES